MVLDILAGTFQGFFNLIKNFLMTIQDITYILYALILAGLFLVLNIITIWVYYKAFQMGSILFIKFKSWFSMKTDRFKIFLSAESGEDNIR